MSGVGVIILSTQWLAVVGSVPTSTTWVRSSGDSLCTRTCRWRPRATNNWWSVGAISLAGRPKTLVLRCMQAALQAAGSALSNINLQAVAVGSISLLCALFTPRALAKFVPGSLIGLLAGTAAAYFGKMGAHHHHTLSASDASTVRYARTHAGIGVVPHQMRKNCLLLWSPSVSICTAVWGSHSAGCS